MITASMFEAKTNLSELVKKAQKGEVVVITSGRDKTPVAKLEAIHPVSKKRLGALETPNFTLTRGILRVITRGGTASLEWRVDMKVLLDTHTLLWATLSPNSLSNEAAEIIADESNIVLVSAASAWEIATKLRLGRLENWKENFSMSWSMPATLSARSILRMLFAPVVLSVSTATLLIG